MTQLPEWTFMVYLAGDNNLSNAGEADLGEMSIVGSTGDVNVVAEFDRVGDDHHTKRYHVQQRDVHEVRDLGETDSGDPAVLLDFLSWVAEEYPAKRYALVLLNHGNGWIPQEMDRVARDVGSRGYNAREASERSASPLGKVFFRSTMSSIFGLSTASERAICQDDGSGHSLDTVELGRVLAKAVEKLGQPIDLLGMDACLMSNLEVAYQARPYVRYMVASEELEPAYGWPYDTVLQPLVADPEMPTADWAAHIVKAYIRSYADRPYTWPVTQAALNLAKLDQLTEPLDDLAQILIDRLDAVKDRMWKAQKRSANFYHHTLWDISHFCEELEKLTVRTPVRRRAEAVRKAVRTGARRLVVSESHSGAEVDRCAGVTVYLPAWDVSRFYAELDYARDHAWLELLQAYHAI
jgi:hypothetical protein